MKRISIFTAYGILAIVINSTVLSSFSFVHFDFVLMAVIAIALSENSKQAIPCIVILGSLLDAMSSAPFGLSVFSYLVIYGFFRTVISKISVETLAARFIWVGTASLVGQAVSAMLILIWSQKTSVALLILGHAWRKALFDAVLGLVMIPIVMRLDNLTWDKIFRPKGLVLK